MDRRKCERSSWELLVECPHELGEHEPREARFEAQGPIVKCDPFCVAAAVPVEPSLDLQQASVSDDQNRVNLRRRSADPLSDVSVEILLQLLDALGRCQSDGMTISTDVM